MVGCFTVDMFKLFILRMLIIMPLLEFQAQIASGLTQAGKLPARVVAKRGRPSASPLPVKKSKTSAAVATPQNDVRYDGC